MSIQVHSFVWIQNEHIGKHVGYIEDMHEDVQGKNMVTVRYFLFAEDIQRHVITGLRPKSPREIFASTSLHEVNVESVDGAAKVLNQEDFKKCHKYLPRSLASKAFLCYREYEGGFVFPFVLSDLEGYSAQQIIKSAEVVALETENANMV